VEAAVAAKERALAEKYGELMSLEDVVKALRYPSVQSARKAILRGSFPLDMLRLPPRRGLYVTVKQVAIYLAALDSGPNTAPGGAKHPQSLSKRSGTQHAHGGADSSS
jgi:hypothetical protein